MYGRKPINVSTVGKITYMLMKQNTHTITRKSTKLEREFSDDVRLKPSINYKGIHIPIRPPRITGYLFKIGKVLGGKNRRYFELNPIEGNLIKYMRKEDYPKSPKEMYCITDISNLSPHKDSGEQKFHFFEVI